MTDWPGDEERFEKVEGEEAVGIRIVTMWDHRQWRLLWIVKNTARGMLESEAIDLSPSLRKRHLLASLQFMYFV